MGLAGGSGSGLQAERERLPASKDQTLVSAAMRAPFSTARDPGPPSVWGRPKLAGCPRLGHSSGHPSVKSVAVLPAWEADLVSFVFFAFV